MQFDAFCARLPAGSRSIARTAYYRLRTCGEIDFRKIKSLEELLFRLQLAVRKDLAEDEKRWREILDEFERSYRAWKAEFKAEVAVRTRNGLARSHEESMHGERRRTASLEERAARGIIDPRDITGWGRQHYGGYSAE